MIEIDLRPCLHCGVLVGDTRLTIDGLIFCGWEHYRSWKNLTASEQCEKRFDHFTDDAPQTTEQLWMSHSSIQQFRLLFSSCGLRKGKNMDGVPIFWYHRNILPAPTVYVPRIIRPCKLKRHTRDVYSRVDVEHDQFQFCVTKHRLRGNGFVYIHRIT